MFFLMLDTLLRYLIYGNTWTTYSDTFKPSQPSGHYMYTSSTFNNSTFCPHSVFMCFMCISEQTVIISLYNIKWLVFITEKECVYCAVRTGYFYPIYCMLIFEFKYLGFSERYICSLHCPKMQDNFWIKLN